MKQRHGKRRTRTDRGREKESRGRKGGGGGRAEDKNKVPQFYQKKEAEIRKQK